MRASRTALAAAIAVGLALALSACGSGNEGGGPAAYVAAAAIADGPWADEFRQAHDVAPNEFQRAILADGVIEDHEAWEALHRMAECLTDAGFPSEPIGPGSGNAMRRTDGGQQHEPTDAERARWWEASDACQTEWVGEIDALFHLTTINPENLPDDERFIACLADEGLAPAGFTFTEFAVLEESLCDLVPAEGCPLSQDGENLFWDDGQGGSHPIERHNIPTIPLTGVPITDPGVWACRHGWTH